MEQIQEILTQAEQRAISQSLPYRGSLLPDEAYYLMQHLKGSVLVDVRCVAEWQFVGQVQNAVCIEWKTYPGMQPNAQFLTLLAQQVDPDATVMMLCRSGVRSAEAASAATQAGFSSVFNVLEGFEGEKNAEGHRGQLSGWKARGLPWGQG